jgi:hypothetical protein
MVTGVFILMFLATVAAWLGRGRVAAILMVACIGLYVAEFLWEVWSPQNGFSMPWLQGDARPSGPPVEG